MFQARIVVDCAGVGGANPARCGASSMPVSSSWR